MTNTPHIPEGWLSYTVAAARYGVSVSQLRKLAQGGEITRFSRPHRRPRVLLSEHELEDLLGGPPRPLSA